MQFVCTPFRTKYTSQYIYIPFNEIIPQIFNFIYRSGDNRVNKSRRQSLKLPPRLSFFFFFCLFSVVSSLEREKKVITRDKESVRDLSIDINFLENY